METSTRKSVDDWLYDQFARLANTAPRNAPPQKKIAIISTPRCGSTFFCESLARTGRFGDPSEWLNPRRMAAFGRYFGQGRIDLRKYLGFVIARTTTPNGVFTLNFHVDQYIHWRKQNFDPLALGFDHIFYLYRRNKIAQAYSYAKALVTDQWRSSWEPARTLDSAEIRNSQILSALKKQSDWDEFYAAYLDQYVHARYCYEELTLKPADHFHSVLEACGIEHLDIADFNCGMNIQRSENDSDRVQAFIAYLGCTESR